MKLATILLAMLFTGLAYAQACSTHFYTWPDGTTMTCLTCCTGTVCTTTCN